MASRDIEQIKDRLPIQDVIGSYIKLDRAGGNFKGKCPFHNERTPSFMVSPDRGSYYCFGCSAKGDIFTFIQEFEKMDFKNALKLLADRAGVVLETRQAPEARKEEDEKDILRKIMDASASFFEDALQSDAKSLEYLTKRGLQEKTIKEWRIGSTKLGWSNLYEHIKLSGFKDQHIEKAGLAKKGNHGFYDRFRSRVIFPIFDPAGKVIAFTGRFKDWEKEEGKESEAKYLNSPDTPLFDKSKTLYGFHVAKSAISKWKFWLLVEGQMDLLMSQQTGYANTVATSGTALTSKQLEMMARFSKNLLIAYDGDKAGVEAARRAWSLALSLGMDVKIALLPQGSDPADLILSDPNVFKESIKRGVHIIEFYLRALLNRGLSGRNLGREVEKEILPYVKAIESPIEQAHFVSHISSKTDIKEEVLFETLRKMPSASQVASASPRNHLPEEENDATIPSQQHTSKHRLIAGTYLLLKQEDQAKKYIDNADQIRDELMFVVEEWLGISGQAPEDYLQDLLKTLEKERLQAELRETLKKYFEAEAHKKDEEAKDHLRRSDEIRKELAKFI